MANLFRIGCLVLAALLTPSMALAQGAGDEDAQIAHERAVEIGKTDGFGYNRLGLGIGVGVVILGAGLGIGRIGGQAVDGMSRQPEVADKIQTAMIIAAALIEGATFFALIVIGFIIA